MDTMTPSVNDPPGGDGFVLSQILKQLEKQDERLTRLDERMRNDMDDLRRNLVDNRALQIQLEPLVQRIVRVENDCKNVREELNRKIDAVAADQISKQDRLWLRVGQLAALVAIVISLLGLLSHFRVVP